MAAAAQLSRPVDAVGPWTSGWCVYVRYLLLRVLLWLTRRRRTSRFSTGAGHRFKLASSNPYEYGALPTADEVAAEWPLTAPANALEARDDALHVFCASAHGQILSLTIRRRADRLATVSLYLRVRSGASYVLPRHLHVDQSREDTFAVDGLRCECIIPLRRWRLSFNGLLRNLSSGKEEHFRFVFTGNTVTALADLGHFHWNKLLAVQLARSACFSLTKALLRPGHIQRRLQQEIDSIVQTFSFVGKIRTYKSSSGSNPGFPMGSVGDDEEVYAFGQKKRFWDKTSDTAEPLGTLMAYTRNGISIFLEEQAVPGISNCFTTGAFVFPSFRHRNIEAATLNLMQQDDISRHFTLGCGCHSAMEMHLHDQIDVFSTIDSFEGEFRKRTVRVFRIKFYEKEGHAVFLGAFGERVKPEHVPLVAEHLQRESARSLTPDPRPPWVVSLQDPRCADERLTGGKASSLALLSRLAGDCGKFTVSHGLTVTTAAYQQFAQQPPVRQAIENLQKSLRNAIATQALQDACSRAVEVIGSTPLPEELVSDIRSNMSRLFGDDSDDTANFSLKRFAVRSSAVGEDSEDLASAGQMQTFLGIYGFDAICDHVAKCWASQFSYTAVQYKRRYAQPVDSPMAVCIQEMVPSEVSGVMFTVEPSTCNPKFIVVTANHGLGESVVSATAEPDTFILEKCDKNSCKLVHTVIGAKKISIIMNEDGGTKHVTSDGNVREQPCLSVDQLAALGEAARYVERYFAGQRDIEWAIAPKGENLVLLQARPITSIHQLDPEFEFYHESDDGVASEYDCLTKANVGEVFGGCVSTLTVETISRPFMKIFKKYTMIYTGLEPWEARFAKDEFFFWRNSQCFFATYSTHVDVTKEDLFSKALSISMAGRTIDDDLVRISADNKRPYMFNKIMEFRPTQAFRDLWVARSTLEKSEALLRSCCYNLSDCKNSRDMLFYILSCPDLYDQVFESHTYQILYGTVCNIFVLAILSSAGGGWTPEVFAEFSRMVSSCNNIVSAEVPVILQEITSQIETDFGKSFKDLSVNEALEKLQKEGTETARMFANFLSKHGHRGMYELDLATLPWAMNPRPVVQTIQTMLGSTRKTERVEVDADALVDSVQFPVTPMQKRILRVMVSRVRHAIAQRERSKNNLIETTHRYRLLFRQLAERLVEEGRLPDADLLFFLGTHELARLVEGKAPPRIIMRALHRQKNSFRAAKDVYTEHVVGLPIVPMNARNDEAIINGNGRLNGDLKSPVKRLKGTPVLQGRVTATCRVVLSLDEAHEIQPGDILITYATDIGWSPYFPLLSGIVTELGGLISHGAVVAREFGLPCLVAAQGATRAFKSGERIVLDSNKGFLQSVDEVYVTAKNN